MNDSSIIVVIPVSHGSSSPMKTQDGLQSAAAPRLPSDMHSNNQKIAPRGRSVALPNCSGVGPSMAPTPPTKAIDSSCFASTSEVCAKPGQPRQGRHVPMTVTRDEEDMINPSVILATDYHILSLAISDQHCEDGRVFQQDVFEQSPGTTSVPSVDLVLLFPILPEASVSV